MAEDKGLWPHHRSTDGKWVPCSSNPCRLHSSGDIMAASPEDAYEKANGTEMGGLSSAVQGRADWNDAKNDIGMWSGSLSKDFDGNSIDWDFIRGLDLENGIGVGTNAADPIQGLRHDYEVRAKTDSVIRAMQNAWMYDRQHRLTDFRLPRGLARAARRLNDEIDYLKPIAGEQNLPHDPLDDIMEERKRRNSERRASQGSPSYDWRARFLPGRDVSKVVGIDLETSGLDPIYDYVIDAGWEYMDMSDDSDSHEGESRNIYTDSRYSAEGAYGQHRESYGLSDLRSSMGNDTEDVSGISAEDLAGHKPLDDDPDAQKRLLHALTSAPFVAHNANFEHHHFMLNVAGYAEAYRAGKVTIIDTLAMSVKWGHYDDIEGKSNNKLDTYAKRFGGLSADGSERHLGLEDSHIMLVAMKNHLRSLKEHDQGPWGVDGKAGVGGKTCR